MHWRLGMDLGTNSIGWWAFRVFREVAGGDTRWRVIESLDGGVLVFPDGREPAKGGRVGDSLAVNRRTARGMRRNRDRGNARRRALIDALHALGLLPPPGAERDRLFQPAGGDDHLVLDPYRLRARAVTEPLPAHHLGRALTHLGLRRGFKSTRREASDEDGGKLKQRMDGLAAELGGRTLGQYLWDRQRAAREAEAEGADRPGIRFRADTAFYSSRAMYADEFERIRAAQAPYLELSDTDWANLRALVLDQRPLRPVERGRCEFFPDQPRHWRDTPIGHDFRIFQEVNNLKLAPTGAEAQPLSQAQRAAVLEKLMTQKSEVKFASLRKLKGTDKQPVFPPDVSFNLEDPKRKGLKPHGIAARMRGESDLMALWQARESEAGDGGRLDDIFELLHAAEDDEQALTALTTTHGLAPETARKLVGLNLSQATAHVSRRFMTEIVPILRDQGLVYSDAVAEMADDDGTPLHHSLRDDGTRFERLPYYGQVLAGSMLGADPNADPEREPEKHFGKINNPTVHVALNQVRRLVNRLAERFGAAPVEIHVETTRALKQSRKQRDETTAQQAKNQRQNEERKALFPDRELTGRDLLKIRLWEELGEDQLTRRCIFSGRSISTGQLLNGEIEIEHILPFSRTLDDGFANLTLAHRQANRLKQDRTPHEAFGLDQHVDKDPEFAWEKITQRAERLPRNKQWRFGPDAMDRFERDGGFIARQLTDTAYTSRAAQRYLASLDGVEQVISNPGRLTALARGKWHFNGLLGDDNRVDKDRSDHRHHAIDAAVIGLLDRAALHHASNQSKQTADDRLRIELPPLDETLVATIRDQVRAIIVAHKPDHGLSGRLYKETAHGLVDPSRRDPDLPEHNLVARKPITQLTEKECAAIRDPDLRRRLDEYLYEAKGAGLKHDKALEQFSKDTGVKRVRLLIRDQTAAVIPSAPYKAYLPDSYAFCDIWRKPKGRKGKWRPGAHEWEGKFWSYAECADTAGTEPDKELKRPHPGARFVMRVFKDDLVAYEEGGQTQIMRVAGFSTTNNKLDLKPHNLANADRSYKSINALGPLGLRKLVLDEDGTPRRESRRRKP